MSILADAYYYERAVRLDLGDVPEILEGQPVTLLGDEQTVPVHIPELPEDSPPAKTFRQCLDSVSGYILTSVLEDDEHPRSEVAQVNGKNRQLSTDFIGKVLIPSSVKTGKIDRIQLQALARDEVNKPTLNRLKQKSYPGIFRDETVEDSEVYFGLTGRLRTGGRQIDVGGLVVARAIHAYDGLSCWITTLHHSGTPLRSNKAGGDFLLGQSQLVSNAVVEHNLRHSYGG